MNDTNKKEFAFPSTFKSLSGEEQTHKWGMTMLDYFAAKAMPGLIARNWSSHKGTDEELVEIWARSSYRIADVMMKARAA